MIVNLEHLLEVVRLQLGSKLGAQEHGGLLSGLIHREQTFHLTWLVDSFQCFLGMERGIQVLVSDRVPDWNQNSLALLFDDLVADEACTLHLLVVGVQSDVEVRVFPFFLLGF